MIPEPGRSRTELRGRRATGRVSAQVRTPVAGPEPGRLRALADKPGAEPRAEPAQAAPEPEAERPLAPELAPAVPELEVEPPAEPGRKALEPRAEPEPERLGEPTSNRFVPVAA